VTVNVSFVELSSTSTAVTVFVPDAAKVPSHA
jgi:hypothetical protein